MGERGPAGPDEETLLRAWDMKVAGASSATIAREFKVSVTTANRYVRQGRDLAEVVDYTDRVLDPMRYVDIKSEQARQAATAEKIIEWMNQAVEGGRATEVEASLVMLKAMERRAKALGSDPPTQARLDVNAGYSGAPPVDPEVAAKVRAYREYQRGQSPRPPIELPGGDNGR